MKSSIGAPAVLGCMLLAGSAAGAATAGGPSVWGFHTEPSQKRMAKFRWG